MPKRVKQKKRTSDENEIAFQLVQRATQEPKSAPAVPASISEYMAQIGRKGGKESGKQRMKKISPEQRREIAHRAAVARWKNKKKQPPD